MVDELELMLGEVDAEAVTLSNVLTFDMVDCLNR